MKKLNAKQQRFIDEYLIDLNGAKAAIRAGYSAKTAYSIAEQLLRKLEIQKAIQEALQARADRTHVTQDRVLLEIARLAFNNPRKAFDANGALLPVKDWPDEIAAAIASVKVLEVKDHEGNVIGETKEIKFWDKGKQLELAARHLGMLRDKVEHSGGVVLQVITGVDEDRVPPMADIQNAEALTANRLQ